MWILTTTTFLACIPTHVGTRLVFACVVGTELFLRRQQLQCLYVTQEARLVKVRLIEQNSVRTCCFISLPKMPFFSLIPAVAAGWGLSTGGKFGVGRAGPNIHRSLSPAELGGACQYSSVCCWQAGEYNRALSGINRPSVRRAERDRRDPQKSSTTQSHFTSFLYPPIEQRGLPSSAAAPQGSLHGLLVRQAPLPRRTICKV